jgi:thiosulfate/3-mercaptopyruvate sulfurtransferase
VKISHAALALASLLALPARAASEFISVAEAKALLGKPGVRFVFSSQEEGFAKGHIPGSVAAYSHDLHLLDDVKACKGLPMCEARAAKLIGETLGVDAGTEVVVYDPGHGVDASGNWFFFKLYGVKSVRILDGGLATWKANGGPLETGPGSKPAPRAFSPSVQWDMVANLDEVRKATQDPAHYLLLDARHTLDEFTGRTLLSAMSSPGKEQTVKRGGAIPGAVFSPFTKYAGNKSAEPNKPTLKDAGELAKQLEKLKKNGYDASKTVVSYCHVGLGRAAFQYLALVRAGHGKSKVYIGSWDEWGNDASLPLASQP